MKLNRYLILILLAAFVASCGSKRKAAERKQRERREMTGENPRRTEAPAEVENEVRQRTTPRTYNEIVDDYIRLYAPVAQQEMELYHIPASITLAQGILESGAGQGRLSRIANNHFGIKCHEWSGAKVYQDDDARHECFRKYREAKYSFRDHSLFLAERGRYQFLFDLDEDDYKGWARGLRKAGYATDRRYPDKLIDLIQRFRLYRFDDEVLGNSSSDYSSSEIAEGNSAEKNTDTYIVQKGDTLYSIAKRYNTSVEMIQKRNNLHGTDLAIGQILYIVSPSEY
ncbi:MAG: glucosaminidase domain-containing protein [Salegentibacter sp.]